MANNKEILNQNDLGDNAGLFGNTILYSMGNLFSRSINFLLLPIYSNVLNTYEFGIFSLVFSSYTILSFIFPTFLQYGFTRFFISETNSEIKKGIYSSTFYITFSLSFFLSVSLSVFSKNISYAILGDESRYLLILLLGWSLFIDTITLYFTNYLKSNQLAKKVIKFTATAAIASLILNIIFLFGFKLKTEGVLLSQIISNLISSSILFILQKENLILKFDLVVSKKIILFSVPLLISGIFGALIDVVDRFLLNAYFDKATVGIYSFSYRIAMVMNVLVMSFRTAWIPYATEEYKRDSHELNFGKNFTRLIAITCFLFLIVALSINDLFQFKIFGINFFNKEYESGTVILPIILISYIFNGLFTFYSIYPFISGKNYHIIIADGISLLINIGLNLILIPKWGIMGAAHSTVFSYLFNASYLMYILSKHIKIQYQPSKFIPIILQTALFYFIGKYFDMILFDIVLVITMGLMIKAIFEIRFSSIMKILTK